MVGSPSKFGKDYRLRAFKTGDKISLDYLNSFITENKVIELDYKSNLTLEQAKEKYPEWYDRKIVKGISAKKTWNVKRDLYDWWKRKIIEGATYGHRYFCIMVLAIYAQKCGIEESELKRDAYELMPILNDRDEEPFTEQDIKSALKSYKENYKTFPRKDIEKITAIAMPENKRNYRTQEMHLKGARAIQEINNPDWRNEKGRPKGSGTKEKKVKDFIKKNPDKTPTQIARELGVSRPTVYKYLKK